MFRNRAWASGLAAAAIAGAVAVGAAFGQPPPSRPASADDGLRNVQVLKGVHDVLPTMHVMRSALGVTCDYCHVAERDQYYRDDKPAKRRAREMMLMMAEINRANFGGRTVVTCNTCHRGNVHPVAVPPLGQGAFEDTTHAELTPPAPPAPTAAEVLARYVKAVGGADRLAALNSRVIRMTVLRSALVSGDRGANARVANRGQAVQVEALQALPDRYSYVRTIDGGAPQGLVLAGAAGWIRTPQGSTPMVAEQIDQVMREWRSSLDLRRELELARRMSSARAVVRDAMDGRTVYVLTGAAAEPGATERLYFDAATGLLTRRTVLRPTQVGPDPEQTDYADYRLVDGLLLPFRITTSYLDDNHLGVTRIIASVRNNPAVDAHAFEPPAPPAPLH